jgi:hypothetical protein
MHQGRRSVSAAERWRPQRVAQGLSGPNHFGFTSRYAVFTAGQKTVCCFDPATGAVRELMSSKSAVRTIVPIDIGPSPDGVLVVERDRLLFVEIRGGAAASTRVLVDGVGRLDFYAATFNQRRVYWIANHLAESGAKVHLESCSWDGHALLDHCELPAHGADVRAIAIWPQRTVGQVEDDRVFVLTSSDERSYVYAQWSMQTSPAETLFWHLRRFEFLQANPAEDLWLEVGRNVYADAELVRFAPQSHGIPPTAHPPSQHSPIETVLVAPQGMTSLSSNSWEIAWTSTLQDGIAKSMVQYAKREGPLPYGVVTVSRDHSMARCACLRGDGIWWVDAGLGEIWHASRARGAAAE